MRHVKRYQELFEAQNELSQEQIKWLDKCTAGSWTLNPQTGLVDVDGHFYCNNQNLTDFKGVRFGVVIMDFICSDNKLTSLEGAPQEVGGDFSCSDNKLTSLKGAPQSVGLQFGCSQNELTSLKDAPQEVGGSFFCGNNELTSLEGAPKKMGGNFYCPGNPVSESVLKSLYKKMKSGMSWPDAIASQWKNIKSVENKILLATSNSVFRNKEIKVYQALARLKIRSI